MRQPASRVRMQREKDAGPQLAFVLSAQSSVSAHSTVLPTFWVDLPHTS